MPYATYRFNKIIAAETIRFIVTVAIVVYKGLTCSLSNAYGYVFVVFYIRINIVISSISSYYDMTVL